MASLEDALSKSILVGVVGSTAYGLDGPDSDIDLLGVYVEPTRLFLGLHPPVRNDASVGSTHPDIMLHEAGKFAHLCLGGNPTAMELLWLPGYDRVTSLGRDLVGIRSSFLSSKRVRDAYLGYATGQFKELEKSGSFGSDLKKRVAKHARHLMRLCHQGFILYSSGRLVIKLSDPQPFHDFGDEVASGNIEAARKMIKIYEEKFNSIESVLPDRPDEAKVEAWLQRVRAVNL